MASSSPSWDSLLSAPCAEMMINQMDSPDSIIFDPYGSQRFEVMPLNAAEIGSESADEIARFAAYVPLPERFGGAPTPPPNPTEPAAKRASGLMRLPAELSRLGSKRQGPPPTVPPVASCAGVQSKPRGGVSIGSMSELPPGADHAALVASIMAAVRYHHRSGKPHLGRRQAASSSTAAEEPSRPSATEQPAPPPVVVTEPALPPPPPPAPSEAQAPQLPAPSAPALPPSPPISGQQAQKQLGEFFARSNLDKVSRKQARQHLEQFFRVSLEAHTAWANRVVREAFRIAKARVAQGLV